VIQLQFIAASESWIRGLCAKDSAKIKVLSMKLDDSELNVMHFVEITSDKTSSKDLTKGLQRTKSVTESNVATLGAKRVVGIVTSDDCKVGLVIMKSNRKAGFLGIAPSLTVSDSLMSYKLYMNGAGIPEFLQSLREGGVSYKISEIEKMAAPIPLTSREKRVLKSALDRGYYDDPKRISTEDLSKKMGLTVGGASGTLRRAEKKIISGNTESAKAIRMPIRVRAKSQ
jgi:predicted DNA binding protein